MLNKRRLEDGILVTEVGVGGANLSAEDAGEETLLTAFAPGVNLSRRGAPIKAANT
jgi:hypothetical protein